MVGIRAYRTLPCLQLVADMTSAASRWSSQESEGLHEVVFSSDIKSGLCYWEQFEMEEGCLAVWKDKISFPR